MNAILILCAAMGSLVALAAVIGWPGWHLRVPKRNPFSRDIPPGTYHAIKQKISRRMK